MGIDEKNIYNVTVQNGQAIIANDNSSVMATTNIGATANDIEQLIDAVRTKMDTLISDEDILEGIVEGVTHMELSRDIWRWHNDRKRFLAAIYLRVKVLFLLPFIIGSLLNVRRIVVFFQFFCHCLTSFLFYL